MSLFSDLLILAKQGYTTYDLGLIQARGYRALKQLTAQVVKEENITTMEWAILGILTHYPKGLLASEVAEQLAVKPPLVSRLIVRIDEKGWITIEKGDDKREKIISLTPQGKKGVVQLEKKMRIAVRPLIEGVKMSDLTGYLRTLAALAENSKHLPQGSAEDYIPD